MRVGALQDWPELLQHMLHALRDRALQVRIVEHDVRRLATEFLMHPLDRVGRAVCNGGAGARRSGEGDHVDVADGRPVAPRHPARRR
jgi:hypothetical protein